MKIEQVNRQRHRRRGRVNRHGLDNKHLVARINAGGGKIGIRAFHACIIHPAERGRNKGDGL
jgi:hypothetical protein